MTAGVRMPEQIAMGAGFGSHAAFGWAVVAGSVVVLVALGTHNLSTKSFWYDEAMSMRLARMAPADLMRALADREANGSLYFVLLSMWRDLIRGVPYDGLEATPPGYRILESKAFSGVRVELIAPG
jgi:hypothetical protein